MGSNINNSICAKCGLWATCKNPCQQISGDPAAKLMFLTEVVSKNDDEGNHLFPGQKISSIFDKVNIPYSLISAVKCRPTKIVETKQGIIYDTRLPSDLEIKSCVHKTVELIDQYKPSVIVTLGEIAFHQLVKSPIPLKIIHGKPHYHPVFNCWIIPTYHPSFISYSDDKLIEKQFREDIAIAIEFLSKPKTRKLESRPRSLKDPLEIKEYLKELYEKKLYALDTETTGLNPRVDRITDISFCHTPGEGVHIKWGDVLPHWEELSTALEDKEAKQIYHNSKFDKKMLRAHNLNIPPIYYDTMLAYHTQTMSYEGAGKAGYSLDDMSWLFTSEGNYKSILEEFGGIAAVQEKVHGKKSKKLETLTSTGNKDLKQEVEQVKKAIQKTLKQTKNMQPVVRCDLETVSLFEEITDVLPDHLSNRLGHLKEIKKDTSLLDNFTGSTKGKTNDFASSEKVSKPSSVKRTPIDKMATTVVVEDKPWMQELSQKKALHIIEAEQEAIAIKYSTYLGDCLRNRVESLGLTPLEFYSAMDADVTLQIHNVTEPQIRKEYEWVYFNLIMPLCDVLTRMEENGVLLDQEQMHKVEQENNEEIESIKKTLFKKIGYEFNVDSPKELGKVIYEDLKIKPNAKHMTDSGKPSTDKGAIEFLATKHPQLQPIVRYRELQKQNSTNIKGFLKLIDPDTGRIYTNFMQHTAATGRLSSSQVNLQNIPQDNRIRNFFIPSPGCKLISADLSQAELRVLAMIANDINMLSAFDSGMDFHSATACKMFGYKESEFDKDNNAEHKHARSAAKQINFGIAYQMGAQSLAGDLNISLQEAEEFINKFYKSYPYVHQWIKDTQAFAMKHGYVETVHGRRRYLPEVWSSKDSIRERALRQSVNTPIQGSASDCTNFGLIRMQKHIDINNLKSKIVMVVHDDIIVDTPEEEVKEIAQKLPEFMTLNLPKMSISLVADSMILDRWCKG